MYPRHSIMEHRSLGKISPVAYYIHGKKDKTRPPKSPFLMINLHLSHGQPRAKMSKRGSDPCPRGLQSSQEDKADTHKRAERRAAKTYNFCVKKEYGAHMSQEVGP